MHRRGWIVENIEHPMTRSVVVHGYLCSRHVDANWAKGSCTLALRTHGAGRGTAIHISLTWAKMILAHVV